MAEVTQAPLPTPEEHRGISDGTKRAVGTLAATALMVNGAASAAFAPKGLDEELPNMHQAPRAEAVVETPVPNLPENPADLQLHIDGSALNEYQQDYRTNPEDITDTRQQIREFVQAHAADLSDPERIESVVVTGLASAENNGENYQDQNEENDYLAGQRGFIAAGEFLEEVRDQLGVDLSGKLTLGAHEDMLSDEEVTQLEQLASQFGYDSPKQAVDAYNGLLTGTPGDVPPAIGALLDDVLASHRGADIDIDIRKPGMPPVGKEVPPKVVMAQHTPGYIPETPAMKRSMWDEKVSEPKKGRLPEGFQKVTQRHKQPRNHNFSKNVQTPRGLRRRGRMPRTQGGDRRGRR